MTKSSKKSTATEEVIAPPTFISAMDSQIIYKIHDKAGAPFETREESVQAMRSLMGQAPTTITTVVKGEDVDVKTEPSTETITSSSSSNSSSTIQKPQQRPPLTNVHGKGPLLTSNIPESARKPGVCVGIDEAGRGSVLGPMVYGAAFWNASLDNDTTRIPKGFHDSKQLTAEVRSDLLEQLMAAEDIGWCARIIHASEISRNMLRAGLPYNLNQMSHDAAMAMIQAILDAGVPVQTCYIDTVGNPEYYRKKLEYRFPNLEFVVESKADANYVTCSASSVVAKVLRDRMTESWQYSEPFHATVGGPPNKNYASGYPGDPKCKAWMRDNLRDPVFGWPDVVRFSWGPAKKALLNLNDGYTDSNHPTPALVQFEADDDDEEGFDGENVRMMDAVALAGRKRQQNQMSAFLKKGKKDLRLPYFERNHLKAVTNIF